MIRGRLVLFVSGGFPNSIVALENLRSALVRRGFPAPEVEVVDVLAEPERALAWNVRITPTLVWSGQPFRERLIGDLSYPLALAAFLG